MLGKIGLLILLLVVPDSCKNEVQRLRRDLSSPSPEVRAYAARRLGELRDRNSVPLLIRALNDSALIVSFEAALALGKIRDRSALIPLRELAGAGGKQDLAIAATKAIADFGLDGRDYLIELLDSPNPLIRLIACQGLGQIGANQAVEPLIRKLDDTDPLVRKAALRALRRIGDPRGMEAIIRKISSPDRITEQSVEEVLSGEGYPRDWEQFQPILRKLRLNGYLLDF
jgi:HEAT repeat protein